MSGNEYYLADRSASSIVRVVANAIFVLSLIYVVNGALLIWHSIEAGRLMAYYGVKESVELYTFATVGTYLRMFLIAGIFFLGAGILSLIIGANLRGRKEWARKVWLGMAVMLSLLNILWLVWCYYIEHVSITHPNIEQPLQVVLTILLALVSWALLTKESSKKIFQKGSVAAFTSIQAND